VTATTSTAGTGRVLDRRRAVALAHHYRDVEDLSIRQIADRLGRSPATVKAYFYDPSHANKRPTDSPTRGEAAALVLATQELWLTVEGGRQVGAAGADGQPWPCRSAWLLEFPTGSVGPRGSGRSSSRADAAVSRSLRDYRCLSIPLASDRPNLAPVGQAKQAPRRSGRPPGPPRKYLPPRGERG
jgi:hypothetical protein